MSAAALRGRPSPRVLPPDLDLIDSAAVAGVALLVAVTTTWAVVSGGWNQGLLPSVAVAGLAVAEAALIAQSRIGRLTALAAAPVLGVLAIVPLTLGTMTPDRGAATLAHVAGRYAGALVGGVVSRDSWTFIVGVDAAMWVFGFWVGWVAVRERRGVLAVLPGYFILVNTVLNAPRPDKTALAVVVALGASLWLLARVQLSSLMGRWSDRRVIALPGTRGRFAGAAVTAGLAVLLAGVLVPAATTTDRSGSLFHFTVNDLAHASGTGSGGDAGGTVGSQAPGSIGFSPDVQPGGTLVNDPRPVITVVVDTAAPIYLRVSTDTVVDRGNWFPGGGGLSASSASGPLARDRAAADGGAFPDVQTITATITLAPQSVQGALHQGVFAGEPDAITRTASSLGYGGQGGLLSIDHVDVQPAADGSSGFTSVATVSSASEATLRAAGRSYPSWLSDAGYLETVSSQTPFSASDAAQLDDIAALARAWTVGLSTPYDIARAIENHLRGAPFTYTLTPPAPRAGEWAIHSFLTRTHTGYCQYYASSMGLMLRLLNIPTRLVSGYGDGTTPDAQRLGRQVTHTISTTDAHVWVEAYFPGHGWITFEPTPSTPYGTYEPVSRPDQGAAVPAPAPTGAAPTPPPAASTAGASASGSGVRAVPGWLAIGGLAALAVAATLGLLRLWVSRPRGLRGVRRRVALLGWLLGVRRRDSETTLIHAHRLGTALPRAVGRDDAAAALVTIAQVCGKADYAANGLDAGDERTWRQAWPQVARAVPALVWRGLRGRRRHQVVRRSSPPRLARD